MNRKSDRVPVTARERRTAAAANAPMTDRELREARVVIDKPIASIMGSHQACQQLHDVGVRLFTQVNNMAVALQAAQDKVLRTEAENSILIDENTLLKEKLAAAEEQLE